MTGGPSAGHRALVVDAPAACPRCGHPDICLHYAPGEHFADLHCGSDDKAPDSCGWRITHFVGIDEPFVVVTLDTPEPEDP